jgi:hypothetical protein
MFPCRGKNGTAQVDEMMNGIPTNLYDTIWIDVETNPSAGCGWVLIITTIVLFSWRLSTELKPMGRK